MQELRPRYLSYWWILIVYVNVYEPLYLFWHAYVCVWLAVWGWWWGFNIVETIFISHHCFSVLVWSLWSLMLSVDTNIFFSKVYFSNEVHWKVYSMYSQLWHKMLVILFFSMILMMLFDFTKAYSFDEVHLKVHTICFYSAHNTFFWWRGIDRAWTYSQTHNQPNGQRACHLPDIVTTKDVYKRRGGGGGVVLTILIKYKGWCWS